jgi:RNA polymerase sigma factor (sigma-70 family)
MAARSERLLRHLRRIVSLPVPDPVADAALLDRFVRSRDQDAFAALVSRHGPMVLGVCRRVLHDAHHAEDAFQATFLVLARKADTIHPVDRLAAWLHSVARQVALKALRGEVRRRHREARRTQAIAVSVPGDPLDELTGRELLHIFDEELQRLPDAYRLPLTLCALEGLTQEEAARRLGWTAGSVRGRLERGRARLHVRLARRGLTLAGALAAVEVARVAAPAAVTPPLTATTIGAALAFASGRRAADSGASPRAALLADGMVHGINLTPLKLAAALLVLGVGLAAAGVLAQRGKGTSTPELAPDNDPPPLVAGSAGVHADADGDPLPAGAELRLGSLRLRHQATLRSVVFAPDGKLLASGGWGPIIHLWDPSTGREARHITAPEKGVDGIAYSPDGKLLAGAGIKGAVLLWDAETGREVRRLEGHHGQVHGLAFSPKGDRLLSGADAVAHLWDIASGKTVGEFGVGQGTVSAVAFAPDGRYLAVAGGKVAVPPTTSVWEVESGKLVQQLRGEGTHVFALAFTPDSTTLLIAVDNGPLGVWDITTGKTRPGLPGGQRGVQTLTFSPDGKLLATGGSDRQIHLWDWAARKERWHTLGHPDRVQCLSFSPSGEMLASSSAESAIHLWDVATGKSRGQTSGHQERLTSVAYSRDGRTILTSAWDRTIRLWDAHSGKEQAVLATGTKEEEERNPFREGTVSHLVLSPDGKLAAAVRSDESIPLWDLGTRKEVRHYRGSSIAFSPDGKLIACGGRGTQGAEINMGVVYLYDLAQEKPIRELHGHKTPVGAVVFSPDGQTLISQGTVFFGSFGQAGEGETQYLRAWDVSTGKERRGFPGSNLITKLTLSPDGRTLATFSGEGKNILLLETATGGQRVELRGHPSWIFGIAFSPDGRTLASGGMDDIIRFWDVAAGKELGRLEGHRGWVQSLAFSPDGQRLVSGSNDTTALIWDVTPFTRRKAGSARLSAQELRSAWDDLGGSAAAAYRAIEALGSAPEQSVPLLAERVQPVGPPDEKRIAQLLADLDSAEFEVRRQATAGLEELGALAGPAVRKALAGNPSAEAKRRLEDLVGKLDSAVLSADEVRAVRLVEALEHAGTAEARQLLTRLAGGVPDARLTREAKAALLRPGG